MLHAFGPAVEVTLAQGRAQPAGPVHLRFTLDRAAVDAQRQAGHALVVFTRSSDAAHTPDLLPAQWDESSATLAADATHLSSFLPGWLDPAGFGKTIGDGINAALGLRFPKPDCAGNAPAGATITVSAVDRDVAWPCLITTDTGYRLELNSNSGWAWLVRTSPPLGGLESHGRDLAGAIAAGIFYQTSNTARTSVMVPGDKAAIPFDADHVPAYGQLAMDAGLSLVSVALDEIDAASQLFGVKFGLIDKLQSDTTKLGCLADVVGGIDGLSGADFAAKVGAFGKAMLDCLGELGGAAGALVIGAVAGVISALFVSVAGAVTEGAGLGTAGFTVTQTAQPVLGRAQDRYSVGFGSVKPSDLSINSLCDNTITAVRWDSWGGATAVGHGQACVPAGEGGGTKPVDLLASDKGDCHGSLAYRHLKATDSTPAGGDDWPGDICG
ncbi:hypothetical protein [Nocardia yunnanensis]|nr:hypothetical protein [Nocardia yunnanensis]